MQWKKLQFYRVLMMVIAGVVNRLYQGKTTLRYHSLAQPNYNNWQLIRAWLYYRRQIAAPRMMRMVQQLSPR
jgi:hypothetical protein